MDFAVACQPPNAGQVYLTRGTYCAPKAKYS